MHAAACAKGYTLLATVALSRVIEGQSFILNPLLLQVLALQDLARQALYLEVEGLPHAPGTQTHVNSFIFRAWPHVYRAFNLVNCMLI